MSMLKPSLQVRLSQHLALTPQLQQSIRLLQLSTLELQQEIGQLLEQNPFLEVDDEAVAYDVAPSEHAANAGSGAADDVAGAMIADVAQAAASRLVKSASSVCEICVTA